MTFMKTCQNKINYTLKYVKESLSTFIVLDFSDCLQTWQQSLRTTKNVLVLRATWDTSLTWEPFPINKHICAKLRWLPEKKSLLLFENYMVLYTLFAKFGWNLSNGSLKYKASNIESKTKIHLNVYIIIEDRSILQWMFTTNSWNWSETMR